jgi:hypothetical protein
MGVTIQIYTILIVYLILQLRQIPQIYADTLLNKLKFKLSGRTPVLVSLYVKFYVPIQHFWDFG